LEERENWRALQQYMIRELHQPVYRAWLRAAVGAGDLSLPGYAAAPERYEEAAKWVARGWEWVDPAKEGEAYRAAVRDGFMTRAEVIMSRGGDYQETIQALAEEKRELDELGLVLDTDPEKVSAAGLTQARPAGSVLPPPATGGADPSDDAETDGSGSMGADQTASDDGSA
jgi:capsid protein